MSVRVRVLGSIAVEADNAALTGARLGGARERRLLAVLAIARGEVVSRDALMDRLWERTPKRPEAALDTAVSLLRRALGPGGATLIETCGAGYRLTGPTDLDTLEECERAHRFDDALDLLGVEPFGAEPANEWLDGQRAALVRRRQDLLVAAGEQAAGRGDDAEAVRRFGEAVDANGLREDAHRGLIAALARLGRGAEALRAFEHCRRTLREELGIDPSPQTTAVYQRVVAGQPPEPAATTAAPPVGELPFLGRDVEHRRVAQLVADETPRLVVVIGEPGIGKTRLVNRVLDVVRPDGTRMTKAFALTATVPYAVLVDLVPELFDPADRLLAPEATLTRLASRLATLAAPRPLLLVIDDLQWADEPSLQVLALGLRSPARLRVVATAREADLTPHSAAAQLLDAGEGLGIVASVTLDVLRPEDLEAGGFTFADWEHTGGHPLLLTERARGGQDQDLASLVLDRATLAGDEAVELLRVVAVLDRAVTLDELATITDVGLDRTRTLVARLAAAALLVEDRGRWRARHDIIADLVRNQLAPEVRQELHRRILHHLTVRGAEPAELAHHALGAQDWDAAAHHSVDAGERSLAAFANRAAVEHFSRSLTIAGEHTIRDPSLRYRAIIGQARALVVQGKLPEATACLAGLDPATGHDEVERLLVEAEAAWAAMKPSQAVPPAQRALRVARGLDDELLVARVDAFLANPYGSLGELDRSLEHLAAAMTVFERRKLEPPALLWYRMGLIQHHTGHELEALATLQRCTDAAQTQYDERSLVLARLVSSWSLAALGRYGDALAALDEIATIGKGEEVTARARVPNTRASLLYDLGLIDAALDADEESLEIVRAHAGSTLAEPQIQTLLNLAVDHLALGQPDTATRCLQEAEQLSVDAEYGRFRYLNRLHYIRGLLALANGDRDTALDQADRTQTLARRFQAPKNEIRARLLRAKALALSVSDREHAARELRRATRLAEQLGLAALAEQTHRAAADLLNSAHHARRANQWRHRIVSSVDEPLRARLQSS